MATKRPPEILLISLVSFLIGGFYFLIGAAFLGLAGIFSSAVGGIFKGIGLLILLLGSILILMAIGLLMMAHWARKWAADFYGLMAGLALLLAFFNIYMAISFVVYLLFYFYLKSSKAKKAFGEFGYEPPKVHEFVSRQCQAHHPKESFMTMAETEPAKETSIKVPENMVLCPQCETLNLKSDKTCKMCASTLEE